ncbi:DUF1330 domain-containing protein [Burkholderia sp. PAMC 26561]
MLVQALINDDNKYGQYRQAVMPLINAFGGKPVRGGKVEQLEGRADGRRIALFEFPSIEAIRAFWNSPQYVPVKAPKGWGRRFRNLGHTRDLTNNSPIGYIPPRRLTRLLQSWP